MPAFSKPPGVLSPESIDKRIKEMVADLSR
jgi:hypothetical protein